MVIKLLAFMLALVSVNTDIAPSVNTEKTFFKTNSLKLE